jgi:hypothetical protein
MGTARTTVLAMAAAALLLASLGVGDAAALRSLSLTSGVIVLLTRELSFQWGTERSVICPVGLTLTPEHDPIPKTVGTIGRVLLRVLAACTEGTVRFEVNPYSLHYLSYDGTLPNISGLNLQALRVAFLLEIPFFFSCLYTENVLALQAVGMGAEIERFTGTREQLQFTVEAVTVMELPGGVFLCPGAAEMRVKGRFTPVGMTTIRLL